MKVDLAKDPLFEKKESPVRALKERELERQRQMRIMRMNPVRQKQELKQEVIDPLPQELITYKDDQQYKKSAESSKASYNLKKYIIEQERKQNQQKLSLKCLRLDRIDSNEKLDTSRSSKAEFKFNLSQHKSKREDQKTKQINIPKVEELFKDQQKEYVLYESKTMKNSLAKAIQSIDSRVNGLKSYSLGSKTIPITDSRKLGGFPLIHQKDNASTHQEQDVDKLIEKKLKQSQKLRERLYRQKKQMSNHQNRETSDNQNLSFFLNKPVKPKKKVLLKGVKAITFHHGDKQLRVTPASSLLFELNRMMVGRDKKQRELSGLLQNSFQNRQAILFQKSNFYEQESPFNDLSSSHQFKLRQLMDRKLLHRLELSKEQVNKFVEYLVEIKEQYHVILNDTILEILKQIREILMSGKVMKTSDLAAIVEGKQRSELLGHPNQLILQKLFDMMI